MPHSHENMSPAAQKLIDKVGINGSVKAAIAEDPSLIDGLDEYTQWCVEEGKGIGSVSSHKPMAHEVCKVLKKLRKPKRRK